MAASFLFCGIYGLTLALLIDSHHVTDALLDLFIKKPYEPGTLTTTWMNWHAIGCGFVGVVNLLAGRWSDVRARRDVSGATVVIFGIWALQNLYFVTMTARFLPFMWTNVIGCAIACGLSVVTVRRLSGELSGAK